MALQAFSSISSLAGTMTSPVAGSTMSLREVRPRTRAVSGVTTFSPSMIGKTSMPLGAPQSSSVMITSCDTSTSLRVR